MNKNSQKIHRSTELLGAICACLIIVGQVIPLAAIAQQQSNSKTNPCPKIFYEEPHNSRIKVPQGCPPNDYIRMKAQGSQQSSFNCNLFIIPLPDQKKQSSDDDSKCEECGDGEIGSTQGKGGKSCPFVEFKIKRRPKLTNPLRGGSSYPKF